MKYFAYGSNMLNERLQARVSSASNPVNFTLEGYSLRFHKRSSDGSGKCNIVPATAKDAVVHGVIFDVAQIQIETLDDAEGVGHGYERENLTVKVGDAANDVALYVATPSHIDDTLQPYDWYLDLVLAGAEQHSLPKEYSAKLKTIRFTRDLNLNRKARMEAIRALEMYQRSKIKA